MIHLPHGTFFLLSPLPSPLSLLPSLLSLLSLYSEAKPGKLSPAYLSSAKL
jgi:hypothetical protein